VSVEEVSSIGNLHKRALEPHYAFTKRPFSFGSIDGWKGER
jgi:hypothetical protein